MFLKLWHCACATAPNAPFPMSRVGVKASSIVKFIDATECDLKPGGGAEEEEEEDSSCLVAGSGGRLVWELRAALRLRYEA